MAFFALLWKARTIEKYKLNYEKEKINSIVMGNTRMEQTLSQRWRHYRYDTQKRISSTFKKWYPEGSGVANFFLYLKTDQTFPNFLMKSLMGFVGGIILTYICFMFFVFQLSISLVHSTIMSSIIGVLLTLGLAFSYRIRCLVFLLIPQFFSRVGRYTLTCYALVLILTGPATNTLKNSEVLSESMACSQEQIKNSVHHLNELSKKPYKSMKESIKLMVDRFKAITMRVQQMVVRLNRLVFSIVGVIQYSFAWLQSTSNICNAKLGSPYKRCADLLQSGIANYKKTAGPDIAMHCNMGYLVHTVCGTVKPYKAFCGVTDFMDEDILANIRKKLKNFTAQIRALFHVQVHIHNSYSFISNNSRSASQVAAGIVTEIRYRTGPLLTWLSWSSCVTSLFLLLIIFRAKYYQHMYETRSRFDNRYITKELQELDLLRQRQGRETVLPLNRRELAKYITTTSFRLVASEKMYLTRSAVFMLITTFKLLIHIVADYSLYWVLMTIRYHGQYLSNLMPGVPFTGAYITGSGFVARLLRSIVDTFSIPLAKPAPSLIPCLPDPYPPDFRRYTQIGVLIFLLWFFALFEPYGLRLRHLIMGQYRPERAKARASWLYNHILRTRAGFMKFARRKLHKKYKYSTESSLTFRSWLNDHIPFQCLQYLLGVGQQEPHCLLCGTTSFANDSDAQLTRCETPKCPGVYCTTCFSDIGQLCTICLSPNDYGDLSDLSLERGSSDDDESGSEFFGNFNESTRLLDIKKCFESPNPPSTQKSTKRWHFFISNLKNKTTNNTALAELMCANFENKYFYKCFKNNKDFINSGNIKRKKYQNCCDLKVDSRKYTFGLDYNNNIVLDMPKVTTVSIGTNTEKCRDLSTTTSFTKFIKEITIYKENSMTRLRRYLHNKKFKEMDRSTKKLSKKHVNSHTLVNVQVVFKHNKKRKDSSSTNVWKVVKTLIQVIRLYKQCSSEVHSVNKNENTHKKYTFGNSKIRATSTPKENETNKNTKKKGKKTKDIQKNNKNKNDRDNNKSTKPKKEKSNKISQHPLANFHLFLTNHWLYIKSYISFPRNRQIDTATFKDKKNHKRRKKRKCDDKYPENKKYESIDKKDRKRNRNYVISSFIADYDWMMKRDYKKMDRANTERVDSCRLTKTYSCRIAPPACCKNKLVAMVQIKNGPFQLQETGAGEQANVEKKIESRKSKSLFNLHKKSSHKALERFKQRIKLNSAVPSPPPSLVNEMINSMSMNHKYSMNVDSSSICLTKRASFYRKFKREALKLEDCGILNAEELFNNDGCSDFKIPNKFQPNLTESNEIKKIDKRMTLSIPSDINMIGSNSTELSKQSSVVSCRFEKCKDVFDNCKENIADQLESCKDKYEDCKDRIRKWKDKFQNKKSVPVSVNVLLDHYTGRKCPSEKIYDATKKLKKMLFFGEPCNDKTCTKLKRSKQKRNLNEGEAPIVSNDGALGDNKSVITRCKCEPLEDVQRKWTHMNEPGGPTQKPSLKQRIKKFCSSIYESACTEKTCATKHLKKQDSFDEMQDLKMTEDTKQDLIRKKDKKQDLKKKDGKNIKNVKNTTQKDQCRIQEDAKLREIQRHIEREKELEREIALEQKRHLEREQEIGKELGYELAKHREYRKKLMYDEDIQTVKGETYVDTGTIPGSITKVRGSEAATQDSEARLQKNPITLVNCECKDKEKDVLTPPMPETKERKIKKNLISPTKATKRHKTRNVVISPIRDTKVKVKEVDSFHSESYDHNIYEERRQETPSPVKHYKKDKPRYVNVLCGCDDDVVRWSRNTSPIPRKNIASVGCSNCCVCPDKKRSASAAKKYHHTCSCATQCESCDFTWRNKGCSPPPKGRRRSPQQLSPCGRTPVVCEKQTSPCERPSLFRRWSNRLRSSMLKKSPSSRRSRACCRSCSTPRLGTPKQAEFGCPTQCSFQSFISPMHIVPPSPASFPLAEDLPPADVSPLDGKQPVVKALHRRSRSMVKNPDQLSREVKMRVFYPPHYDPVSSEWPRSRYTTIREPKQRSSARQPSIQQQLSLQHSPQPNSPLYLSPERHSPQRRSPQIRSRQEQSPLKHSQEQHSSRKHSDQRHSAQRRSRQMQSTKQRSPQTHSTQHRPQMHSTQQRSTLQQISPSQLSIQSPGSPLLLIASPSYISNEPSPFKGHHDISTKIQTPNKNKPRVTRSPFHFTDTVDTDLNLANCTQDRKTKIKEKSILADFSAELGPSSSYFKGVGVNARRSSQEYALETGGRSTARNRLHPDSVKVLYRKHRGGTDTKQHYGRKDERRDKTKGDKSMAHRGSHYNYCWKKYGKKNGAYVKDSNCRRPKLSLESSLLDDMGDQNFDYECNLAGHYSDEGEITDTTYCSLATVHFDNLPPKRVKRRVRIVTHNNQSTSTEKAKVCDTGTTTCDWWSPLIERKEVILVEKKNEIENVRREFADIKGRTMKNSAITADGRLVKFQSGAQIIPPHQYDAADVMTPSRFLLESQRYYNELYAFAARARLSELPYPQHQAQKVQDRDKGRSPIGSRRTYQRKTKRLDETISPRKVLCSPRRRHTDSTRTSDSPRIKTSIYRKSVKRYYAKLN